MDEQSRDPNVRSVKVDWQTLVYEGKVSTGSLDVPIEGTNITLKEYYESIRPPD